MKRSNWLVGVAVAAAAVSTAPGTHAQDNAPSRVAGSPNGFDYPMSLEATQADPKNHRVLYEDARVRLLEVTLWPGDREGMHGHAYPSVFAFDAVQPKMDNDALPGDPPGPPHFGTPTAAPSGPEYPRCVTMAPQRPHAATVRDPFPQHFYRLEFKRLSVGDTAPVVPRPTTAAVRPFGDAAGRDGPVAAPKDFAVRFQNDHVRLVEVSLRPGETTPALGSPFNAVLAFDSPVAEDPTLQRASHPPGWDLPTCQTERPTAPRPITNSGPTPLHYYRIEFARVDGTEFPDRWREWYPAMAKGPPKTKPAS